MTTRTEQATAPSPAQVAASTARLAASLAVAALMLISGQPSAALAKLGSWLVVLVLIGLTGLEVLMRLGHVAPDASRTATGHVALISWIEANQNSGDANRLALYRQLFYNGRDARSRITRYCLLMSFASLIATAGILADSTAVVIGAMLVAPLITPMMGMALGLTMGWQSMLAKATSIVVAGMTIAIGIGVLMPEIVAIAVDTELNAQIASRSSPTLIDLVIAIAAGAAGSYALARPDVSSSLPGVAIAIALVPPLSVLGILLNQQAWGQAAGAALLFATNLIAILITGGLVFLLTGAAPLHTANENQHRVRVFTIALGFVGLVVVGALAANGAEIARDSLDVEEARTITVEWLGEAELDIVSLDITGSDANVVLAGADDPPPPDRLADELGEALGRTITVDLQWIPRERVIVTSE